MQIELFEDPVWQMSTGERSALEGLLSQLAPELAIEIGSAEGACLRRIAAHSTEVHSFDLTPPSLSQPDNVTLHTGDSHRLLPQLLAEFETAGRNVDFVMVDGDHSPEGVRRDLEDLLNSRALADSVIVIHDTANERVRQGVDAVRFNAWPKVIEVDLDWVPGRMFAEPALHDELWYGLGLVRIDASVPAIASGSVYQQRYQPSAPLLVRAKQLKLAREAARGGDGEDPVGLLIDRFDALQAEAAALRARAETLQDSLVRADGELAITRQHLDGCTSQLEETRAAHGLELARREQLDQVVVDLMSSPSWKLTKPLRSVKQALSRSAAEPRRLNP